LNDVLSFYLLKFVVDPPSYDKEFEQYEHLAFSLNNGILIPNITFFCPL
jgi:hypothetical protein